MDNEHELKDCNVQAEILFVGSIAKDLDLIVNYSTFMRSKYDFSDPATKFFYDNLETYFLTFSQTLDETKMNVFMSQNEERLKLYKQYKKEYRGDKKTKKIYRKPERTFTITFA